MSAASFSIWRLYSLHVVAPMVRRLPRASAGFSKLAASPVSGTGVGTEQTTSAYTLSAVDVTRGYVSVEVSQAMLDASGEGLKVVSATYRNGSSTQDVVVDGITKTGSVNADHSWTVASFASNELPTSGVTTLTVDISDAAGNPAATVTKSVTIDPFLGGSGADIFYFSQNIGSTQTVTNFTRSQGDKIDLHTLLNGYGCTSANASNFLSLTQNATDAVLKIDLQGLANFSTPEHTFTMTGGWSNAGGLNDTLNNLLLDSVILI